MKWKQFDHAHVKKLTLAQFEKEQEHHKDAFDLAKVLHDIHDKEQKPAKAKDQEQS